MAALLLLEESSGCGALLASAWQPFRPTQVTAGHYAPFQI